MMKWNHHYDATISNTVNFIENLSPSIVVQTSGADINRQSTTNLLREKNIQTIKAYSKTKDATVFDISDSGFQMYQTLSLIFLQYLKSGIRKMATGNIVYLMIKWLSDGKKLMGSTISLMDKVKCKLICGFI